ncbi:MAG: hydrogenase expression/formation protein HypE [Deltaproteobacteria bacterium]|nr:MAG: hydrogenase expression/formation protein HypE [Deltaproteobacteria bacterium]
MQKRITTAHGGGGEEMRELISGLFFKYFSNPYLEKLNDFAKVDISSRRIALSTDSFVVEPWSFPGGNIGDLAVCGTVNDISMSGATPLYLTCGFILPEGMPLEDLEEIVSAMARRASEAGVLIVTGDTKVVGRGAGPFINTAGVGAVPDGIDIGGEMAKVGDEVIVTGAVGSHGIAVLSKREGLSFSTEVLSDCAPLNKMVAALIENGIIPKVLRDPTRGGVAGALNEISVQSGVEIEIEDEAIPIEQGVRSACDMLGYDPLHIANEGCMLVVVSQKDAQRALELIQSCKYGEGAARIGRIAEGAPRVTAKTLLGTKRLVDPPSGELLPRIC